MRENKLRWFGRVERRNNDDIVKKVVEISVERNQERERPKKKWMEVVR